MIGKTQKEIDEEGRKMATDKLKKMANALLKYRQEVIIEIAEQEIKLRELHSLKAGCAHDFKVAVVELSNRGETI